jgi:aldehyde dehydrogenase (NAD+)
VRWPSTSSSARRSSIAIADTRSAAERRPEPSTSAVRRIEQEEIFGPVTCVIPFSTLDEAIDVVNGVKYGLSSAIYTQDVNHAFYAMQELYTGICYVNSATIGAEVHLPFGGTKGTGNGHREAGTQVLDIFSEWKSLYIDYSGKLQKAQIDEVEI